jgi:hypothetical protein
MWNTASMKPAEGAGTGRFRAGWFDLGIIELYCLHRLIALILFLYFSAFF